MNEGVVVEVVVVTLLVARLIPRITCLIISKHSK